MQAFRAEGGLFGIMQHRQAAHLVYLGLHAIQHRGIHGAGLVVSDGSIARSHYGKGLVHDVFNGTDLQTLAGRIGIGQVHNDLVVTERTCFRDRPFTGRYQGGNLAVAFVGHLTNARALRAELKAEGALFSSRFDAEVLLHLMARSSQATFVNRLVEALWRVEGAYALLVASDEHLVAVRDPRGFRPLLLGTVDGAAAVATEDAPFLLLGGEITREVEPGEMIILDPKGASAIRPFLRQGPAACSAEVFTLTRPDAHPFERPAYRIRAELGARLAEEHPAVGGQVVVALPDAVPAGLGFSRAASIPFEHGLMRAPYTGRHVLEPAKEVRGLGSRLQVEVVPDTVAELRVVLVVAALSSGIPARQWVRQLREAGASEVHLRVAAPPATKTCPYGVLIPGVIDPEGDPDLGADSVGSLSRRGLHEVLGLERDGASAWCDACMGGELPLPPEAPDSQLDMFTA